MLLLFVGAGVVVVCSVSGVDVGFVEAVAVFVDVDVVGVGGSRLGIDVGVDVGGDLLMLVLALVLVLVYFVAVHHKK